MEAQDGDTPTRRKDFGLAPLYKGSGVPELCLTDRFLLNKEAKVCFQSFQFNSSLWVKRLLQDSALRQDWTTT